jgi:hypothetical protein
MNTDNNLLNYIGINEMKIIDECVKDNEFVALYYYIDSNSYTSNLFDPPYITYELIILVKNKDKYMTQTFIKRKYANELRYLNINETYNQLLPLELTNYKLLIEYPLIDMCKNKGLYSIKEASLLKKIINKIDFPSEILNLIMSYLIVETYDLEDEEFIFTNRRIDSFKFVGEYYNILSKKVFIQIKNKKD